jgi:hypothetical protein
MLGLLRALFNALVDILLLRRGPENVPASVALLALVITLDAAVTLLFAAQLPEASRPSALNLAVSVALSMLAYRVILGFAGKPERFLQTMIAVFGTNAIFSPVVTPMLATLVESSAAKQPPPTLIVIGLFLIGIWGFVVSVYILRSATGWKTAPTVAALIAQYFVLALIVMSLFGGLTPATGP